MNSIILIKDKNQKIKQNNNEISSSLQIIRSKSQKIQLSLKKDIKSLKRLQPIKNSIEKTPNLNMNKSLQPSPRLNKQRQAQALKISRNISHKIYRDNSQRVKFIVQEVSHRQRKQQLSKKIQEINKRNQVRLKQLQQFQDKFIKKLTFDFQKDHQVEKRLKGQYEKMERSQKKMKAKKIATDIVQTQGWKLITAQKTKLDHIIDQLDRIKAKKVQQKSEFFLGSKKYQSLKVSVKSNQQQKNKAQDILDNNKNKLNKKQAKKDQKIKLLNIRLKNIDYVPQIIQKIARNTGDLSKKSTKDLIFKQIKQQIASQSQKESKLPQLPKDDGQIGQYLKQIRNNIKQLDDLNKQS